MPTTPALRATARHVCRYRAPFTAKAWKDKFRHVVGVMHTNYLMYSRTQSGGVIKEPMLYVINQARPAHSLCSFIIVPTRCPLPQAMCRAYCHKIIKLSG